MGASIKNTQSSIAYISRLLTKYCNQSPAIASELTVTLLRMKQTASNSSIVFSIGFSMVDSSFRLFLAFGEPWTAPLALGHGQLRLLNNTQIAR